MKRRGQKDGYVPNRPVGRSTRRNLDQYVKQHTKQIEMLTERVSDLTRANNAASMLMSCVERYMDETAPGWDKGFREEVEKRKNLLKERRDVYAFIEDWKANVDATPEGGLSLAKDLWKISKELGTEIQDVATVSWLALKCSDPDFSLSALVEARTTGKLKDPKLIDLLKTFEEKAAQIITARLPVALPKAEDASTPTST